MGGMETGELEKLVRGTAVGGVWWHLARLCRVLESREGERWTKFAGD